MLKDRLLKLTTEAHVTQAELARVVGKTPQAVNRWFGGSSRPDDSDLGTIAQLLSEKLGRDVTREELQFGAAGEARRQGRVPIITWQQARHARQLVNNQDAAPWERWTNTSVPVGTHTFALDVTDDLMSNPTGWPSFPKGTTIIIEPDLDPHPGDYVLVRKGQADPIFRQYVPNGPQVFLTPLNPRYPVEAMDDTHVLLGVVREFGARLR
jgi:SOS-response transcriptional repressor LexA